MQATSLETPKHKFYEREQTMYLFITTSILTDFDIIFY